MSRAFKCEECGTEYTTLGNDTPTSPRWDDGHVCIMKEATIKLEDDLEAEREVRMRIISQNGNTGEHYDEDNWQG